MIRLWPLLLSLSLRWFLYLHMHLSILFLAWFVRIRAGGWDG